MTQRAIKPSAKSIPEERVSGAHLRAIPGGPGAEGGDENDPRPVIRIKAGETGRMVDEVLAILSLDDVNIFQRAGELVSVVVEPDHDRPYQQDERHGSEVWLRPGTPRLHSPALFERLSRMMLWQKYDKRAKEWVAADPSDKVVTSLNERGDYPGIRDIVGIRETPFLAPSGRIVSASGYDQETGFLLAPSVDLGADLPDRPTQDQAKAALRYLWTECFCDFPYVGLGEGDSRSDDDARARFDRAVKCPDAFVGVTAILTVIGRAAIKGAVMACAFEASTQGAGKTRQMHVVSLVTTGRPAGTAAYPTGHGEETNEEEMRKVLGSYASSGAAIVAFDNVHGSIGGGSLEGAMTTADKISYRELGKSETHDVPWRAQLLLSGNNMTMSEDIAQRILVSRLESNREDPRSRPSDEYRHPNLLGWIGENRARLVRAALVVLRAYAIADPKPKAPRVGSFEEWSELIPAAIVYAGGPDVTVARPKVEASENPEALAHAALMMVEWPGGLNKTRGERTGSILKTAFQFEKGNEDGADDLREAIRSLTDTPDNCVPSAVKLGKHLRRLRGKVRNGLRLMSEKDGKGFMVWRVEDPTDAYAR